MTPFDRKLTAALLYQHKAWHEYREWIWRSGEKRVGVFGWALRIRAHWATARAMKLIALRKR